MAEAYTITKQYHEKKDIDIYVVRLIEKVDADTFDELKTLARGNHGYYSSFRGVNGFVFKTEDDAESFVSEMSDLTGFETFSSAPSIEEKAIKPTKQKKSKSKVEPKSHMSLHEALRYIVETEGSDILNDTRLVNILDDFHAYDELPSAKYILRALIGDSYVRKFINIGAWNNEALNFTSKLSSSTGFNPEQITELFHAIAFGLHWIGYTNIASSASNTRDKNVLKQNSSIESYSISDLLKLLRQHKFIYSKGGKYGIMNYAGNIIHEAIYNEVDEYPSAGMIPVRKGKLWGYIDSESSHSIEPQFNEASSFIDNRALVKCISFSENEYVIDMEGNMVIPPIYDSIFHFAYGLACVVIDNMQGFIDIDGEIKVPIEYPWPPLSVQSEQEILITTEYGTKIVDKENNTLAFFNNIYVGNVGGSIGEGKFIVSEYHDDGSSAYGVIDCYNKVVIPCRYDDLTQIKDYGTNEVFLIAKLGKKFGILSANGKLLIPFQYDEIETHTSKNQFIMRRDNKWGIVGIDGKTKIPFMYDEICHIWDDGYDVKFGSKNGRINAANEWITDSDSTIDFPISDDYVLFDTIVDDMENEIHLCHKGRYAYIFDKQGKELLKFNCPNIIEILI